MNNNKSSEYLHDKLKIKCEKINEKYPEQEMAIKFKEPNNNVFDLGGNFDRNSLIITTILNNSNQLLVFESDPLSVSFICVIYQCYFLME